MPQTVDTPTRATDAGEQTLAYEKRRGRGVQKIDHQLEAFVAELQRMTPAERIRASRYSFNHRERCIYAARCPDEVPLINGELEWIALSLA